jgi:DNA modification methylase
MENKIVCADCIKFMKTIPDDSVDLAFTDPPYNLGKSYDNYHDNLPPDEYKAWVEAFISEMRRVSNNNIAVYIGSKLIHLYWDIIPDAKLIIVRKGAIGTPCRDYYYQYSGLLVTAKPLERIYDLWDKVRLPGEGYFYKEVRYPNPGQTSLELTKAILKVYTKPGDLVLDPFMGCGTTAAAAKEMGRKYLGSEISPEYCRIAEERLSHIQGVQLDLLESAEQLLL